jgi:hypothetical protein
MVLSDRLLNRSIHRTKIIRLNTTDTLPLKSERIRFRIRIDRLGTKKIVRPKMGSKGHLARFQHSAINSQNLWPEKPHSLFPIPHSKAKCREYEFRFLFGFPIQFQDQTMAIGKTVMWRYNLIPAMQFGALHVLARRVHPQI